MHCTRPSQYSRSKCLVHRTRIATDGASSIRRTVKLMANRAEEAIVEEAVAWSHLNGLVRTADCASSGNAANIVAAGTYDHAYIGRSAHMLLQIVGQGDGVHDVSVVHAPMALFPTPFPSAEFRLVQRTMPGFSTLVQAISENNEYLNSSLKLAAQYDEFTGKLLKLHNETIEARKRFGSPINLGLHRSDYMIDGPSGKLLQVGSSA